MGRHAGPVKAACIIWLLRERVPIWDVGRGVMSASEALIRRVYGLHCSDNMKGCGTPSASAADRQRRSSLPRADQNGVDVPEAPSQIRSHVA